MIHIPESHPQSSDGSALEIPPHKRVAREERLSQLCPLVFEAAFKDGDNFAWRVLRSCAGALADQIAMLCLTPAEDVRMKPNGVKPENAILCFMGSLVGIEEYRELVLDELNKRGCTCRYVQFVEGAVTVGVVGLAKSGL